MPEVLKNWLALAPVCRTITAFKCASLADAIIATIPIGYTSRRMPDPN